MKKQLLALGTIGAIVSPIVAVVSCGNDYGKNYRYYGDFQVITDAGSVGDKSFNQSAFDAVKDYTELVATDKTFGFSQPKQTSKILMQKAYLSALKKDAKTLILPGFIHGSQGDSINFAYDHKKDYPGVTYISADGFADDQVYERWLKPDTDSEDKTKYVLEGGKYVVTDADGKSDKQTFDHIADARANATNGRKISLDFGAGEYAANKYANYYNLSYASAESGFLAAVYGGLYFNKIKHVTSPIKAATFGGIAIPFGVTSYMDGYLQGIQWFNDNNASDQDIEPVFLGGNKASASDFTNSFDAGGGTAKSTSLINKGAQMILPVAGPQTGDVVGVIKTLNKGGSVYAFGVDTDQTKVYDSSLMLGSAVKGIYVSNSYALDKLNDGNKANDNFGTFNLQLTSSAAKSQTGFVHDFHEYVYGVADGPDDARYKDTTTDKKTLGLMGRLIKGGMNVFDAKIRTLPTGFAPTGSVTNVNTITSDSIYTNAVTFAATAGNVEGGLFGDFGQTNSDKAFRNFGSYIKVAQG